MADQAEAHSVGKYLVQGLGFTADELLSGHGIHPGDARLQEMAWKAKRYDEARLKAKKLRSEPSKVTKSSKARRQAKSRDPVKDAVNKASQKKTIDAAVDSLVAIRKASQG